MDIEESDACRGYRQPHKSGFSQLKRNFVGNWLEYTDATHEIRQAPVLKIKAKTTCQTGKS